MSRIKRHIFLIVGFLFLAATGLISPRACAATFTASLDRDTITLGETATLSLAFEGAQPKNVPTPVVPGLQIVNSGTSQNVSFINGAMSSTVTVTFSVTARRAGEFTIPALTAAVNGQQLSTLPLKLTVLQADAPPAAAIDSGNEIAFMKLSLPDKKVYVGQMLTAQLQVCLRDDVQNFGDFQFTSQPADGFTINKMAQGQNQREQIGNHIYTVIPLTFALTAMKTGTLSLGPFTASATLVVPSANDQGGDPFFRQFFNQGEQKQITLATEMRTAQSVPLPAQNVPANFNGAVGNYQLTATVGPTNLVVGDPVTVRVRISGRGDLGSVTLPDQTALRDFKIFAPTSKVSYSDQLGMDGDKTFEEIVTPQNSDVHEWPRFSFSFFNPDDGKYHTLAEPAVPLVVKAAAATPMPTLAATQNPVPENQTPQDILPIKENLGTLSQNNLPLVAQPVFLATQALPVLAFLAAFVWRKRTDNLANNPRLRRQRVVAALMASGMDDLKKFAAANQPDEFFAALFRLLQEQLGERLDCPASAITENVLEEHPVLRGAPQPTLDTLRELFQLCNQARYAPVRGTSELNSVAAQFEKVIHELQEVKA
ncbi:MAG TPA: BatD family protein [Candidatus Paceibacterota bacterium]|nr:BatD family protein [Candidatus Paceibacterota bacterium]